MISSQDTENIWLGRNDRTWLVGKRNEKSCILGISLSKNVNHTRATVAFYEYHMTHATAAVALLYVPRDLYGGYNGFTVCTK